jgi:hypothetical protein
LTAPEAAFEGFPVAFEAHDDDIWVFWFRNSLQISLDLWYKKLFTVIEPNALTDLRQQTGLNLGAVVDRLSRLENLLTVVPGDFVEGADSGTPNSASFTRIAELTAMRPGTYRVKTYHTVPSTGYGQPPASRIASRVYVNDIESPDSPEYQTLNPGIRVPKGIDTITVEAGDKIQLYARKIVLPNNPSTGVIGEIEIAIGNPLAPAVREEK